MEKIEYFEILELPGKPMFRCEKKRASLTTTACSAMWTGGSTKNSDDRFWQCKGCAIGAKHAGVGDATLSPLFAAPICARCGSGATRLIHGHLCVSCYNRAREWIKGCNARGTVPVTHPTLYCMAIRYRAGGRVKTLTKSNTACSSELIIAALRDEPKQATFALLAAPSPLPQMELFA